jgi:hypothetical protein
MLDLINKASSSFFFFCRKCIVDMINWVQYKLLYMINSEGMCSCVKLLWLTAFVLSTSWSSYIRSS